MPVYGYRCSRGHHFEVQQRIMDAPLNRCPECNAPATRVFYPVGIIFKGQGFYKTDSRGASTASTSDTSTKTEAAKTETAKTETASPDGSAKRSAPPAKPKEEKETT